MIIEYISYFIKLPYMNLVLVVSFQNYSPS